MGSYVDSTREAARRLLRCEGGTLYVPMERRHEAENMLIHITDILPSKIESAKIEVSTNQDIIFFSPDENNFTIGQREPDISHCWVKTEGIDLENYWSDFYSMIINLVTAGYPGCVGCGGPGSETPWDEHLARQY